ncbi:MULTISPECIES: LacI family DNA-binding transcriptional regulator [unclassified Rhizobium]|uniref:LacI family DNA-binding transcriptional regulator n=1 Tax=unclassified Rhizobium TaxID=2613769 RepID=UPI0006F28822|nr:MULTISPECIES: LacI family DNA-binding transcriptional regulator [unclassified Rhizobium]KQV40767.1 LacI family transcriptional regulator [Rhizobium sp. Root1212]KRD36055.1 LacI family transcriptional regulator [Rhizobium sp. Root268]
MGGRKTIKRVTMMDVAKLAGCSQATVSFVLNSVTDIKISADLRSRVLEAARSLGYGTGSPIRRAAMEELRGGCIGFIVDQLATTPEAVNAIEGARQESWEEEVTILVAQTQGRVEQEKRALERLLRAGAQGIVYMSIFTRRVALDAIFDSLPVPLVLLNCYTGDERFPSVVPDEINGGKAATSILIDLGHRRIATIVGESFMEAAQDRLSGYRKALAKAGLPYDDRFVVEGNWTPSSGYEATQKLLSLADGPTAIFCQNDKMATGCFNAIRDAGLSIPDDISVVGYDDDEVARHMKPQLTTLDLPHRAMGAWAIRQFQKPSGEVKPAHKIACSLVSRRSCGPPPAGGIVN